MEKLNELVELAKKATPGKWWIDSHGHAMVAISGGGGDVEIVFATDNDMGPLVRHGDTGNLSHWRNDNDATFITAANPETILAIAEAFRALEIENQQLKGFLEMLRADYRELEQREKEERHRADQNASYLEALTERMLESERRAEAAEAKLAELENQEVTGWLAVQNDNRDLREPLYLDGFNEPAGWNSGYAPVYARPAPAADLADLLPPKKELASDTKNLQACEWGFHLQDEGWNKCIDAILRNIEGAK